MFSNRSLRSFSRLSIESVDFSQVSLLKIVTWFFSISLGPISILTGTPFISHSLNLYPGVFDVSSSSSTLNCDLSLSLSSWAFSITPALFAATGTITTWIGAILGGTTSPLLSLCTITIAPISLVVVAHDDVHAYLCFPSLSRNFMSNILVKCCPRLCEVPAWSDFPSLIIASMVYVLRAPANFSCSVFTPNLSGIAICSSTNSLYSSSIIRHSLSVSASSACTVWPSCQRNSDVLRKGLVVFSHLTTLFHWYIRNGRSLYDFIHFENIGQIIVSDVGLTKSLSGSSLSPLWVTHRTSGAKPSKWSTSTWSRCSGISSGK